ncbi:nucleotide exchange factor GrpE [uncultured Pseudoteredinibacter sp.]|uniref:nucleotide exchange factor GrpE n=1 Tax=uncultured Pseudoteredinibacter sp. TaxID=1641701 RepID=UPI00262F523F|nr:nucleotide exchange factor GrpE [uncultured Pseudoteredinibacter sp.]
MSSEEQNPNVDSDAANEAPEMAPEAQEGAQERVEDVNPAELVLQIEDLQAEIGKLKDQELRTQAEMHNVRRRAEQDVEKAHKFGVEKFVGDMLTVIDNLERALASMDAEGEAMQAAREGIELTLKSMQDGLKRHNVEAIDPAGEPFDPEFHQAMTMVPNPDLEPNTVMDVFQKGYTLHGRLVRPAMVVVAKAP